MSFQFGSYCASCPFCAASFLNFLAVYIFLRDGTDKHGGYTICSLPPAILSGPGNATRVALDRWCVLLISFEKFVIIVLSSRGGGKCVRVKNQNVFAALPREQRRWR